MDLYDTLIQESLGLINEAPIRSLPLADSLPLWKTESEQQLIFQKDMAYEAWAEADCLPSAPWPLPLSPPKPTGFCSMARICPSCRQTPPMLG